VLPCDCKTIKEWKMSITRKEMALTAVTAVAAWSAFAYVAFGDWQLPGTSKPEVTAPAKAASAPPAPALRMR
jgi:hypothetical protein